MPPEVLEYLRGAFTTADDRPSRASVGRLAADFWLHVSSDLGICIAYAMIASTIILFVRKRPSVAYGGLFWLVAAVILLCGITHLTEVIVCWWPGYRFLGLLKATTAFFSLTTALVLVPVTPKAQSLRSASDFQREITQRRRTELELRQIHAQLESVIELRTAELAAKNEEMEQFLNTVSHDLKAPVVTCLGLTDMLRQDFQAGRLNEAGDSVNRIERSVKRMRQLIEDLLHLSRIGKVRFEVADVNLFELVSSIADDLRPRLEQAGVAVEVGRNLPSVQGDARWLTEVFENLITNALKYGCDSPSPRITVASQAHESEARIYVRDNGRGIEPAHHSQIFEPFRRLQTDKEGTGMGLAIVVRIIKAHGGRVWIESASGQGATFWLALPLRPGAVGNATKLVPA
jgi:signal transduction histidine kinase